MNTLREQTTATNLPLEKEIENASRIIKQHVQSALGQLQLVSKNLDNLHKQTLQTQEQVSKAETKLEPTTDLFVFIKTYKEISTLFAQDSKQLMTAQKEGTITLPDFSFDTFYSPITSVINNCRDKINLLGQSEAKELNDSIDSMLRENFNQLLESKKQLVEQTNNLTALNTSNDEIVKALHSAILEKLQIVGSDENFFAGLSEKQSEEIESIMTEGMNAAEDEIKPSSPTKTSSPSSMHRPKPYSTPSVARAGLHGSQKQKQGSKTEIDKKNDENKGDRCCIIS